MGCPLGTMRSGTPETPVSCGEAGGCSDGPNWVTWGSPSHVKT